MDNNENNPPQKILVRLKRVSCLRDVLMFSFSHTIFPRSFNIGTYGDCAKGFQ